MSRRSIRFRRYRPVARACLLVASILMLAGCTAAPDAAAIRRMLGIDRAFADVDLPAPATLAGAVRALSMASVTEISYTDPATGRQEHIQTPQQIASIVDVVRRGDRARPQAPAPHAPQPLRLNMRRRSGAGEIVMLYDPERHTVDIYNVPTPASPNHIVATYPAPEPFGQALLEALTRAARQPVQAP